MLDNTAVVSLAHQRRGILSTSDFSKSEIETLISIGTVAPVVMSDIS
jgi:hypothetical protein